MSGGVNTDSLTSFLKSVITTSSGFFELGVRNGTYKQFWYEWPVDIDNICDHALTAQGDVYFSSYLYQTKDSHKDNVLPSRTLQEDLDDADISQLALAPTILVQTSPKRHQGFWVASTDFDSIQTQELLSKKLAYSIPLCDRSGWPLGHKVRVPYTKNYKYIDGPHAVQIIRLTSRKYSIDELEVLPDLHIQSTPEQDLALINNPPSASTEGAYELVESIKDHLSAKVYAEFMQDSPATDRSVALFSLMVQCFKAGLTREEVYWVAKSSANNKFHADLRYNADRELAKDVIRAEQSVKESLINIREIINNVRRKTKVLLSERRHTIFEMILAAMQAEGDFVHLHDGRRFYIPRDIGRPIEIEGMSEPLHSLLDIKYSLNKTEIEHSYVMSSLVSYSGTLPEANNAAVLAHYDPYSKHILIHGGRKEVHVVSEDGIVQVPNGTYNTVFPWDRIIEPFNPILNEYIDWGSIMFTIPNIANMTQDEVKTILKVWVIFSLIRDVANSRPILALFGQPGSSKTTIARKLYALFYGRHMDVSGATSPVHYDIATASLPFYVLDNLDTWEKWIPDRLAQSAGKTDVIVRKLYTNNQMIRIKRQAMVAVTAHDPKFGRADVTDRMLIINLQRFSNVKSIEHPDGIPFADEGAIMSQVIENRNRIWGSILQDLQHILCTPLPETTDLQLRVQDFARLGEWIALGIGEQEQFREAVRSVQAAQRAFNLDEDHILVTSILRWMGKTGKPPVPKTQDELYSEVMSCVSTEDIKTFQMLYKNSGTFSKRISNLQDTFNNTVFRVSIILGKNGQRLWHIQPPEETS